MMTYENDIVPFLKAKLLTEIRMYDTSGTHEGDRMAPLLARWGREDSNTEAHRFSLLKMILGKDLKGLYMLDMAAGCGNFVLQALKAGYNAVGLEPEEWKHDLIAKKLEVFNLDKSWQKNVINGVGEKMSFADNTFDLFDSWQTFEHVQDIDACTKELYRVTKPGGFGIIRMPSYASFYEGHYQMVWLPYMHGSAAKAWLKLFGRPADGLSTFNIVTYSTIANSAEKAGFKVYNIKKLLYRRAMAARFGMTSPNALMKILFDLIYYTRSIVTYPLSMFRTERHAHLLLVKENNDSSSAHAFINQL